MLEIDHLKEFLQSAKLEAKSFERVYKYASVTNNFEEIQVILLNKDLTFYGGQPLIQKNVLFGRLEIELVPDASYINQISGSIPISVNIDFIRRFGWGMTIENSFIQNEFTPKQNVVITQTFDNNPRVYNYAFFNSLRFSQFTTTEQASFSISVRFIGYEIVLL